MDTYEKKYKEALERAKKLSVDGYLDAIAVEEIFPELRESEDERIRKVIYKLMLGMREEIFTSQDEIVTKEKALAYLEKKPGIKIWPHEIIDAMNGEHDPADIYSEDGRLISKKDESEDERIRKWLVDYFGSIKGVVWIHRDITCEQILEWLERQKEQKKCPEFCSGHCVGCEQKEQKPWKVGANAYFTPEQKPVVTHGETYHVDTLGTQQVIAGKMPQKPAEWSEVELEFRGEKVTVKRPFFRDDKGRGYSTTKQDEEVAWNALRAWCEKKGISIYDLYPKAEWSEEDADILNCCISSIEEAKENRYAYKETDGDTSYDREIAWLKSLRPSWKPSEEDEK